MMKKTVRYKITGLCLAFSTLLSFAEQWTIYEATIGSVSESGYFNIELSQELIGLSSRSDFSDIRILNEENKEVPYFVRSEKISQEVGEHISYSILENSAKDSINKLIIGNPDKNLTDRFYITTHPADVVKWGQIRGSNDRQNWYIVKQRSKITHNWYNRQGEEMLLIEFPKGQYEFYEITITNNQKDPLLVSDVSRLKSSNIYAPLAPIASGRIIQKDSTDNNTYIAFPDLKYPYRLNKLEFHVSYLSDYLRQGTIIPGRKKSFTISSNSSNITFLDSFHFYPDDSLKIINQNNPPVKIDSVSFYGLNRYLCAFLTAGESYRIIMDRKEFFSRPDYDIYHFQNKIPQDIPIIKSSLPTFTTKETIEKKREPLWIEKPIFLWSIILGIGAFLGLLCWQVIKEMKSKK